MKISRAILIFLGIISCSAGVFGQTLNYKIASVYVYNFTKYISWPTNKSTDFVIGIYGASPITDELRKFVAGKHVGEKSITVEKVLTIDEAAGCQIVFIPASQSSELKKISDQLKGKPVLIVCEKEGLNKKGASISIYLDEDDDDKTKFELNQGYIKYNGLLISQGLITLSSGNN
ncbi:MAG TPA: YfiR family protein [Bacteroidia bacterium]|jgi:hypothetical protein|nr:YfiR family protein [Bacteroidia bacterium]